jgi:hypothetical protein
MRSGKAVAGEPPVPGMSIAIVSNRPKHLERSADSVDEQERSTAPLDRHPESNAVDLDRLGVSHPAARWRT